MEHCNVGHEWITVDLWDTFVGESGIVVMGVMRPYCDWCVENIGPVGRLPLLWYNDLYGKWYQINFKRPEDATAFMLMSGGKRVENAEV